MAQIICGDCLEVMRGMPAESVNCCVTSPPYWGLRIYLPDDHPDKTYERGQESTLERYIEGLVEVFEEVKRVLTPDGSLWLNLGDMYAGSKTGAHRPPEPGHTRDDDGRKKTGKENLHQRPVATLPAGNLVGMPWRVAFALQAAGWILRQDIIWNKKNPIPESVKNRCTKAHEYLFHLTKSTKYWYDAEAIKEPAVDAGRVRRNDPCAGKGDPRGDGGRLHLKGDHIWDTRNRRDVWTISSRPYKNAHFATFPPDLIRPCIRAGCPPNGVVLDPFSGAGTTGLVALQEGKHYLGIELNPEYVQMSRDRLAPLMAEPALSKWLDEAKA